VHFFSFVYVSDIFKELFFDICTIYCLSQVMAVDSSNSISWGLVVVPAAKFSDNVIGDASNSIGVSQDISDGKTKFAGTGLATVELANVPRFAVGTKLGFRLEFGDSNFNMDFFVNDRIIHSSKLVPWKANYSVACTLATNAQLKMIAPVGAVAALAPAPKASSHAFKWDPSTSAAVLRFHEDSAVAERPGSVSSMPMATAKPAVPKLNVGQSLWVTLQVRVKFGLGVVTE
jgi:hypothetical protein